MSYLFAYCSKLNNLSDISKWNTSKVINMEGVFLECSSLFRLPDISKWTTSNVINMSKLFQNCKRLKTLGKIEEWDSGNVENTLKIIEGCESLIFPPDFSKWNLKKLKYYDSTFNNSESSDFHLDKEEESNLPILSDESSNDIQRYEINNINLDYDEKENFYENFYN